jgi:hypothetical protein
MNMKDQFLNYESFKVGNGSQIRFWEDRWLGDQPLKIKFPALFNIVRKKQDSVANIFRSSPLSISFRRSLVGQNLRDWNRIVSWLTDLNRQDIPDVFTWSLHSTGQFSVKTMYAALINNGVRLSQEIWRVKMPMKIKIFMWYLKRGVILTKDNLARPNWNGEKMFILSYK